MLNKFNIVYYNFGKIKNRILFKFNTFLNDDKEIAFLISR